MWARRGPLHRSVANPCSVGLSANHREMIFSWVYVNLGGRPAAGRAEQARAARLAVGGDPAPHRAGIDVEELGDVLGRVPRQDALNGQEAAMFQFRRCAFVSHTK
jgi:hypothetical protein